MTDQEINDLQRHSVIQDARISNLETKFEMFMQSGKESNENLKSELKDFKDEMRQQNQLRANEIAEIRKSVESIQESGRNQTLVTFLGIAAMDIAVLLK